MEYTKYIQRPAIPAKVLLMTGSNRDMEHACRGVRGHRLNSARPQTCPVNVGWDVLDHPV